MGPGNYLGGQEEAGEERKKREILIYFELKLKKETEIPVSNYIFQKILRLAEERKRNLHSQTLGPSTC